MYPHGRTIIPRRGDPSELPDVDVHELARPAALVADAACAWLLAIGVDTGDALLGIGPLE
jgi:hypothetical protein